ncbi:MAG: hybrid sensor histidine kinase/response regulator [Promethearchaeota archaeon]
MKYLNKIILYGVIGCSIWVLDSIISYYFYNPGKSFFELVLTNPEIHDIIFRLFLICFFFFIVFYLTKSRDFERRMKKKLMISNSEKKNILNNLREGIIFYKSPNLEILWENETVKHISEETNLDKNSLSQKCSMRLFSVEENCKDCPVLKCFFTKKKETLDKTSRKGKNLHITALPFINPNGELDGVIEIIQDTTKEKKLQDQLYQSQKMEAIGQLAAGIAHDFNNFLTVINGFTELLLENNMPKSEQKEYLKEILKAGTTASNLTHELLFYSKKNIKQVFPIDVNHLIKDYSVFLQQLIGEDIEMNINLSAENCRIMGDVNQIKQCIMNLAVNSKDAQPNGGNLDIETNITVLNQEKLDLLQIPLPPGKYVLISVSDSGVGIPVEIQKKIFEPFFTTKPKKKGSGLGLSTVYGIVHQHHGQITVYSEVNKGTTFKMYFPIFEEENISDSDKEEFLAETIQAKIITQLAEKSILIVEDDSNILRFMEKLLQTKVKNLKCFSSPVEALDLFEKDIDEGFPQFDLVISDVVMPKMNGRQLQQKINTFEPSLPFLFISGYSENVISHNGIMDGDINFLQKPFSKLELIEAVAKFF